jgi:hypothetical protein
MAGCSGEHVDADQLEDRDGLMYFEGKPYTGESYLPPTTTGPAIVSSYKDGKETSSYALDSTCHAIKETPLATCPNRAQVSLYPILDLDDRVCSARC